MRDAIEPAGPKHLQRQMFLVGLIVASVPFVCQIMMLMALAAAPAGSFPAADITFTNVRFWPIQIVLLCVGIAGNAIVDGVRFLWNTGKADRLLLGHLLWLFLSFFIESLMFSITLLASKIGWFWLAGMTIIAAATLVLAYALEMEIAEKG